MDKDQFYKKIQVVTSPLPGSKPYTFTYTKTVKLQDNGKTLLDFYADAFPHKAKTEWRTRISSGKVQVNGQKVPFDTQLKSGWITQHTIENIVEPAVNPMIKLLYEDANILVLDKPAPLPVHPSGRFIKNTVTAILKQAFPQQDYKIVHRLDANTTGILVLAKNKAIAKLLIEQFQKQQIKKTYLALVDGVLPQNKMSITSAIGTEKQVSGARKLAQNGQHATTYLTVIKQIKTNTLVALEPKSGKTNQLRLHLTSIGHPIVGDYGYKDADYFKNNPMTYASDCLMLHAWKLQFTIGEVLFDFVADVPRKFGVNL